MYFVKRIVVFTFCFASFFAIAQPPQGVHWSKDGTGFYESKNGEIVFNDLSSAKTKVLLTKEQLTPDGSAQPLSVRNFFLSDDGAQILIYTNTKRVWRYDTRGDYWLINLTNHSIRKLGMNLPPSSLMFAKFSPDGSKVAYVSEYNLYVEDAANGSSKQLTNDGSRELINGTFDWAYEEEFFCRDGFRWSPDSKKIAYWQMDAKGTKDYLMIDNTDSIYPFVKPVVYPVAGEPPSPFKIGVVDINTDKTDWMNIPTDPILQSYVPRMEWAANNNELIIQHLNRKQNESDILLCNVATGESKTIYKETDSAWIEVLQNWDEDYSYGGWDWLNGGKEFLWASEKDGWRHLYKISHEGKKEILITKGAYDVMKINAIDEKNNYIYFEASPQNATQSYLYRTKLDGKGMLERVSPANENGWHEYDVSPGGKFAQHRFTNHYTRYTTEMIALPKHSFISGDNVNTAVVQAEENGAKTNIEFFTITTTDGITMDAWMKKPTHFDSTKKYPIVFNVYTEPAGQLVRDVYGTGNNGLYKGNMADDGYIYVSVDNRGTPCPKGREWRKIIYRKIGLVNIRDQAMAAREILKRPYVDTSRVAVWGWSGGGSATLNLMFQFPDIYKTGIAIAAVGNQLTYDNIYQERYMGLPQENKQDFINGSPITYAKNLRGNLLYIHGTGDDNVHYSNAEMLINQLIKYNKQFQFMAFPNRSHGIFEGEGTREFLSTLYTHYLQQYCPPGGR